MTIVEAIKHVLSDKPDGLTPKEIYNKIVEEKLYDFNAKNPVGVVNSQIRRRCHGLDFPTAYPIKIFQISGRQGSKNKFSIYNENRPVMDNQVHVKVANQTEYLPEEKIGAALEEHLASIKQQVIENVLNQTFDFFEHLVVELLLKMGYGYGKEAGIVTRKSRDGGIDGIISEDKLGLDLIYIQAKRNASDNKVKLDELHAFVGAMDKVRKGVFITTSSFTPNGIAFIENHSEKNVKLIHGELLSELLVRYEVGVTPAQIIKLYKIDTDYFNS